ncbi:MAG: FAD-dependent monooxygenase, partial [Bdellovibrionales bacterium]|nr:FAD-dependent monooxygenase [Bdellovibrionales bacterium]
MNILVVGGGPAGLYFAIQMLLRDSTHKIRIVERNAKGSTFGWGVVFSDETLQNFLAKDSVSSEEIRNALFHWDDIDIHLRGECFHSSGHGFSGIGRHKLLEILTRRAQQLGAHIEFGGEIDPSCFHEYDVVVAADGVNSGVRQRYSSAFDPEIDTRKCRYIWLGTDYLFTAFTFLFEETEHGWFQAHCYRFSDDTSTFIVECPESVWEAAGLKEMSKDESISFCESLFGSFLQGHKLRSNNPTVTSSDAWVQFRRVHCGRWHHENIVLLGDSAATAHYSIGSGTKLAMESAIALAEALSDGLSIPQALEIYQEKREIEVFRLQSAARNSTEWFENVSLKTRLEPQRFAYSLLTRSQRVSHESLRARDRAFLEDYEGWLIEQATGEKPNKPYPPMFIPLRIK